MMKVFLVVVVAVALVASTADAAKKKKKRVKIPKVTIHEIECGQQSESFPLLQKSHLIVPFRGGLLESGTKAPEGYAYLERNVELGNTYLEVNLFSTFESDQVNHSYVVNTLCPDIMRIGVEVGYNASVLLEHPDVTVYQNYVAANPITEPLSVGTQNLLQAPIPDTAAPRTGSNSGEFGTSEFFFPYIARPGETRSVVVIANGIVVGCAPLGTVTCIDKKNENTKKEAY